MSSASSHRPLRAAIFDLDGLAVDSEPAHVEAWRRAVESFAVPFDNRMIDPYFGSPVARTAEGLARDLGLDRDEFLARRDRAFAELTANGILPRPGFEQAVQLFRDAGVRLALVSSGTREHVERALRGIGAAFEALVTIEDVERPKPDPEPYLLAASRLRLRPEECAALEDAPAGVRSARTAGMRCVAVPNKHTRALDFVEADSVQPDLESAARWLLAQ